MFLLIDDVPVIVVLRLNMSCWTKRRKPNAKVAEHVAVLSNIDNTFDNETGALGECHHPHIFLGLG